MAYIVRKNKLWLIGVFALIVVCGVFLGWQHIYAQSNPTESPPFVGAEIAHTRAVYDQATEAS